MRSPRATGRGARRRFEALAVAVGGLAFAALTQSAALAATHTTATVISTTKDAKLGTLLVADGDTVYALKPSKTACDAKCLKARPPVLLPTGATTPTAGSGVEGSKLGTTTANDGALQVTYDGKPLYWFAKDKSGAVRGNLTDKWGKWSAVVIAKGSGDSGSGGSNAGTGGVSF